MSEEGRDFDPPATLPTDAVVGGKYVVVRLLGSGGMGAVYEARNSWTGRRVAVKLLHPQFARKPEIVRRFLREAKSATAISHPNIVDVLDMGEDPEQRGLYIVQEFLEGMDLARRMQQVPALTLREALSLVAPVMAALDAAHRHGIVHRDIKPENIFLTTNARGATVPKLIDFGISKVLHDHPSDHSRTQTGVAIGTPQYMSPEQARGASDIDGRSDVWSVGVLLYELVTGRLPFEGANYNLLIVAILTAPAPRIEHVAAWVPGELAAVIHRALEPDPARRFASMSEFLGALLGCPLDDGAPLFDQARREAFLSGVILRDSSEPAADDDPAEVPTVPDPAEAPTVPERRDAPTVLKPARPAATVERAPTPTPTQWQQSAQRSWVPQITRRRVVITTLVVVLVGVAATMGVAFGRRTAPPPLIAGLPIATAPAERPTAAVAAPVPIETGVIPVRQSLIAGADAGALFVGAPTPGRPPNRPRRHPPAARGGGLSAGAPTRP